MVPVDRLLWDGRRVMLTAMCSCEWISSDGRDLYGVVHQSGRRDTIVSVDTTTGAVDEVAQVTHTGTFLARVRALFLPNFNLPAH